MLARVALCLLVALTILSPLAYYATGIGQRAQVLGRDPVTLADGTQQSSPKAEALHRLALPIRVQGLLTYPLLLLLLQYSGLAARFRAWLSARWPPLLRRAPGFGLLDHLLIRVTRRRLSLSDVALVTAYVSLFTLGLVLVDLPLSFYQGFVLGHQFGLSTQTLEGWLRDLVLTLGLNLAMTLVLFVGFYGLIKLMPRRWPLLGGAVVVLITFGYTLLEPVLITPLFYQVTPVTDPDLRHRIDVMADRAGVTIDEVYVIDASSRTTTSNAYFTGFGDASKIILWDTLLAQYSPGQVDVVVAHEMGHWVYRHALLGLVLGSAGSWIFLFGLRFWLHRVWQRLGWTGPDDVAGYPYLLGVMALVALLTLPAMNTISRVVENQADDFALQISQRPADMAEMFKQAAVENLVVLDVAPWEEFVFYGHPPLRARIEKAERAHTSR